MSNNKVNIIIFLLKFVNSAEIKSYKYINYVITTKKLQKRHFYNRTMTIQSMVYGVTYHTQKLETGAYKLFICPNITNEPSSTSVLKIQSNIEQSLKPKLIAQAEVPFLSKISKNTEMTYNSKVMQENSGNILSGSKNETKVDLGKLVDTLYDNYPIILGSRMLKQKNGEFMDILSLYTLPPQAIKAIPTKKIREIRAFW